MLTKVHRYFSCGYAFLLIFLEFGAGVPAEIIRQDLADSQQQHLRRKRQSWSSDNIPICATEEYYDANVQACSRCSEICRPNIDLVLCINKCHEYFLVHFGASVQPEAHAAIFVTIRHSTDGAREDRLVEKPLFWTSVVSMTIAVAATVAIIILCVRRRKRRPAAVRRLDSQGTEASGDDIRTRNPSETDFAPERKSLLPPQTFSHRTASGFTGEDFGRGNPTNPNNLECCRGERYTVQCCNNNDLSDLPSTPTHENVPVKPTFMNTSFPTNMSASTHSKDFDGSNIRSFSYPTSEVSLQSQDYTLMREDLPPQPFFISPCSSSSSYPLSTATTSTFCGEPTVAKSLYHEVENDTKLKGNSPFYEERCDELLEETKTVALKPKDIGIKVCDGSSIHDIHRLMVNIRTTTGSDSNDRFRSMPSDLGFVSAEGIR